MTDPQYRTRLVRHLNSNPTLKCYMFLMLNPSTAKEVRTTRFDDDMTIRKCGGFVSRWGGRSFYVGNLFSIKATNPQELVSHPYEINVGPDNDRSLVEMARYADVIVAAWGSWPRAFSRSIGLRSRIEEVTSLPGLGVLHCIGLSSNGDPLHPSRAAYVEYLVMYRSVVPERRAGRTQDAARR